MPTARLLLLSGLLWVLLLATPLQASAECAWVLWVTTYTVTANDSPRTKIGTEPSHGYASKDECYHAIEWKMTLELRARELAHAFRSKNSYPSFNREHDFSCLPDTIDPRGPKVK